MEENKQPKSREELEISIIEEMMRNNPKAFKMSHSEKLSESDAAVWKNVLRIYRKAVKIKNGEIKAYRLYDRMISFLRKFIDVNSDKFMPRVLNNEELKELNVLLSEYKKAKDCPSIQASVGRDGISVSFRPEEK